MPLLAALLLAAPVFAGPSGPQFKTWPIVDSQQNGMIAGAYQVPDKWKTESYVKWTYSDVSFPLRAGGQVTSPDGLSSLTMYSPELFYWLEPRARWDRQPQGKRFGGMVHATDITVEQAIQYFLIRPNRGRMSNLKIVSSKRIPNLAKALGKDPVEGDSAAIRVSYTLNGRAVEEDFFGILSKAQPIPFTGPQGTTYEIHRALVYPHSMAAPAGQLDAQHRLLGFIYASFRPNPDWVKRRDLIFRAIAQKTKAQQDAGFAAIRAAGERSKAITAQSNAFLNNIEQQRMASNAADARARAAANSEGGGGGGRDSNLGYDEYIRGQDKVEDPYWGTTQRSNQYSYHWTDGYGNYRDSNDASYDPNGKENGSWTIMKPAQQ